VVAITGKDEGDLAEIIWHNEKRAIRELIPYEANPRQITDKQAKDLKASLAKFGIADPIIINTDNMIIGGHQRKKILETLLGYDPDFQIDVRVPDRELSIDEARELNVRLNKNVAEWDFDTLANSFELDDLLDWGFSEEELGIHPDIDFDEFDGEGDGGGSRMMNGDKVRVVLGALMFDIPDPDHSIYKLTEEADEDDVRDKLLSLIAMGELP